MNSKRTLAAGVWILLLTLTLAACDLTGDAPAGVDGGQILSNDPACTATDPHPVAESIADQFDVEYEQVMTWFCNGEGFDDILLALQSAELNGRDPEVLLAESDDGWEEVWANDGTVDPELADVDMGDSSPFDDQDDGTVDDSQDDGTVDNNHDDGTVDGNLDTPADDGSGVVWEGDRFRMTGILSDKAEGQRAILVEAADDGLNYETYIILVPHDIAFEDLHERDRVEVEGIREADGDLVATQVRVTNDGADGQLGTGDDGDKDDEDEDDRDEDDEDEDDRDEDNGDENGDNGDRDNELGDDFGDANVRAGEWNFDGYYCRNLEDPHPVGWRIAERYDVDYEQVMEWFCQHHLGMGEIMLALQTADETGDDPDVYVQRRLGGEGWGQIWQDLGLIGRPEDGVPPGRGNDGVPPGQQKDNGNPGRGNDGAPPGQQKDKDNPGRGNDGAPPGQQKNK